MSVDGSGRVKAEGDSGEWTNSHKRCKMKDKLSQHTHSRLTLS